MAHVYEKTTWQNGMPISASAMNNIEDGIKNLETDLSGTDSLASTANGTADSALSKAREVESALTDVRRTANSALDATAGGTKAWQYVSEALIYNDAVPPQVTTTLRQRFESISSYFTNSVDPITSDVLNAHAGLRQNFESLTLRLRYMESAIEGQGGAIENLESAKGSYSTLLARLQAEDADILKLQTEVGNAGQSSIWNKTYDNTNNNSIDARFEEDEGYIKTIRDLLEAARSSTVLGKTTNDTKYTNLVARFEAIEGVLISSAGASLGSRLNNIEGNITSLSTNKMNANNVAANLTTDSATVVLAANQGVALKSLIDNLDTAYKAADTALSGRIDAINTGLNTADTGLVARVGALESEVDMTSADGSRRIDLVEGRLNAIDNGTNTMIDGMNDKIDAIAGELGMLSQADTTASTRIDTIATNLGTAQANITGLQNTINDASTGLAATKAIADAAKQTADAAATASSVTTLAGRVTTLENKPTSATEVIPASRIIYDGETGNPTIYTEDYDNTEGATNTAITPSTSVDYLLQNNTGKYFYWKYIQTGTNTYEWKLISGGAGEGGGGSSSGQFAASLSATDIPNPDVNTDYFVGNNNIGYTHYRYVVSDDPNNSQGTFVRILPKGLLTNAGVTVNGGLEAYTIDNDSNNLFADFVAFKDVEANPIKENDVVIATDLVFTDTNGQTHTARVQGGGGGAIGGAYTVRLTNTLNSLKLTVPKKEGFSAQVSAQVVVKDGGVIDETFDQSHTIVVDVKYRLTTNDPWTNYTSVDVLSNTEFTVDVESILTLGSKTYILLTAKTTIDGEERTSSLTYEVTQVEMSIAAINFNQATVRTTDFNFQYRCIGSGLTKTVHFLIDDTEVTGSPITTTLHNDISQQLIPLTGLQVGMHSFKVYFTVGSVSSNILNYYIIYNNDSTRQAPIVALAAENSTITYGDDLKINYTVATAGTETTDEVLLELFTMDGSTEVPITSQTFLNVENEQVKDWRPVDYPESGTAYIRATATHTINEVDYTDTKTISITINELQLPAGYTLNPAGTDSLVYSYSAYGRTNNDADKEVYHYNYRALTGQNIQWTGAFNNFNWSGNGYVDGQTLTISGGATHTVNVPIFQNSYNGITLENSEGITNISKLGRTIEIEYEVSSATDLNDVIINYMADGAGIQVTPQNCYLLKSGSTINMDSTGFILNESDVAAAYLTPGMRIHLAFVIEPWSDVLAYDQSYHQSVNIYVNGEFANSCPYVQGTDSFANSATLRIGSSSCIIKLYKIKMYNRGLTQKEILQNYKIAPAATRDKLSRLYDNDILNVDGYVDYEKARTKYTCLLLTGPAPIVENGAVINPTVSPYKGYPSPANRKDKKTGEVVGKTESGLTLTKPNAQVQQGYDVEFELLDKIPTDQSIDVPAYMGARGAYISSNNVQGTSSQKYPVHNLKVYLAKWQGPKTTTSWVALEENEEVPEGTETKTITYKHIANDSELGYELVEVEDGEDTTGLTLEEITYKRVDTVSPAEIKKVKYSLKGKDENGDDIGGAESTLCWKADYMSTDHANTFNANIADGLFSDILPGASWGSKHQNTVYGIRCLLFQKQGNNPPEFLGDGCLNNDKGNNKTYDLEREGDDNANTSSQKWEFTNNSDDLGYFKTDTIFKIVGEGADAHIQAKDAFESTYPDEGDLNDAQTIYKAAHNNEENPNLNPNYNHLQILLTWLSHRANYWDETDPTIRATKKQIFIDEFTQHINLNHALVYYLFSEYVALCDNRVKNMFMRSDNIKSEKVYKISDGTAIFEGNSNPNADFFKAIDTIDTGTTQQVAIEDPDTHEITYETQPVYRYELHNRDDIDWENSTFAIWAPVLYDLDSCFGVENVGYLRVRYDAEWNYTWNDAPQFNGYESRLWLQFADCFDSKIKAAALTLYNRQDGLNYTNFYRQQITSNLNCISPALTNQDMLIKFDKPWSEGFMNYSLSEPAMETPYYKYLQRGSRTAQKSQFMNMRSKLLSSKYGANEFTNDAIKFRTGVPVGQDNLQDTKITIIANQAMYPGIAYGDNKPPTRATANGGKVNAGQSCDIYATSAVQGNDGVFICGASMLTDIGDLSKFRPYQIDVGAGVNLKRLIVGSNAEGYTNGNTDTLMNLNKCALLEEVNVRNCSNVSTLDLQNNPLIKKVYAAGSGATTIIFPNGGVLNTVEYGAATGNITLRNQKSLAHFSYENSSNNHYGALTKLWIENTPNVPVIEIINTRMANLTAGVRLVGINIDLFEGATTQEEIEAALTTTTLFLNTITSELATGKYLDSTGAFMSGNTEPPYISGTIRITRIRSSLYNKLREMYPDLTVIYNQKDEEFAVTYKNYDGTVLYTDYGTSDDYVKDPVYDVNPVTNAPYIPMPTKPDDVQYKYKFGLYTAQNRYRRFTGWVRQGTSTNPTSDTKITGTLTYIAVYPEESCQIQQYTVTWYEDQNSEPLLSYTENYGIPISEFKQPEEKANFIRAKTTGNGVKVFKGWDRPVGKLTQNINVYAQWEYSSINDDTQNIIMSQLTAADVYALASQVSSGRKDILLRNGDQYSTGNHLGEPIMINMGQDYDYTEGVTTINLMDNNEKLVFDGTSDTVVVPANGVYPLATNSDWTLAIDYQFLLDSESKLTSSQEFVLASCYQNANSSIQGFKLSLVRGASDQNADKAIQVTWGTQSIVVDYLTVNSSATDNRLYCSSYRNVVVLSHDADHPQNLIVYYTPPLLANNNAPKGANYGETVVTATLTWENNETINAPIIFGGNYAGTTTNIENTLDTRAPAQGIIYWAKYWTTFFGEKYGKPLAAWPHETVPFYLSGYNGASGANETIYNGSSLSFVAAQGLGSRYSYDVKGGNVYNGTVDENGDYSWHNSKNRNICNNIIYEGMPTDYKSIIRSSSINSSGIHIEGQTSTMITKTTSDYLFLPSECEVSTITSSTANVIKAEVNNNWSPLNSTSTLPGPWHWLVPGNITNMLEKVPGSASSLRLMTSGITNYFLYRFSGHYIKPTSYVFYMDTDPASRSSGWNYNSTMLTVRSGDVWIDSTTLIAYMYFTNQEIAEGERVDMVTTSGGWKRASIWNLRTYSVGTSTNVQKTPSENLFKKISYTGAIPGSLTSSNPSLTEGRLLCPEFTV